MNKNDLIDHIAQSTKLSKADSQRTLERIIQHVQSAVKVGQEVRLVGFGTFLKSKRRARRARNPQTGAHVEIAEHFVPRFRPGKEFKENLAP